MSSERFIDLLPLSMRVQAVDAHDVLGNHLPDLQSLVAWAEHSHLPVSLIDVVVVVAVVVVLVVIHLLIKCRPPPVVELCQLWEEMLHKCPWWCSRHWAFVRLKASGLSTYAQPLEYFCLNSFIGILSGYQFFELILMQTNKIYFLNRHEVKHFANFISGLGATKFNKIFIMFIYVGTNKQILYKQRPLFRIQYINKKRN